MTTQFSLCFRSAPEVAVYEILEFKPLPVWKTHQMTNDIFLIFPRKQDWTFHAYCLQLIRAKIQDKNIAVPPAEFFMLFVILLHCPLPLV